MPAFIEGKLTSDGLNFALIASRFNSFIVDRLVEGLKTVQGIFGT